MKLFQNKKCPRCGGKMPTEIVICPHCQLNFQKFDSATNQEAKQAIQQGETDRVLMRTGCPSDVSKTKLLLMAIFLGFTGAHYYYVGRHKFGLAFTIFFIIGVTNAIISSVFKTQIPGDIYQVFTFLVLGWGLVLVLWIIDIAKITFNQFKIPVSRNK